jgi:hypothetical protein
MEGIVLILSTIKYIEFSIPEGDDNGILSYE